jgi:signal-transduction protein with cAMP-binding, CBS, and nucleotidyltransferase domain
MVAGGARMPEVIPMPQREIRSIIERQKVLTAPLTTTVAEAARLMKERHVSAMMVVGDEEKLAGIFTERDALFRVIAEGRSPKTTRVCEVMTANPQTIGADRPFAQALLQMHEGGFRHMPVVKNGHPIGMVSARDALDLDWEEFALELERRERIGVSLG